MTMNHLLYYIMLQHTNTQQQQQNIIKTQQ